MADKRIRLISLDIETTGLDPAKHVPLSIGAVDIASGRDYFVGLEWDELIVDTAAMRINRIDITRSDRDAENKRPFSASSPGRTLPAARAIQRARISNKPRRSSLRSLRINSCFWCLASMFWPQVLPSTKRIDCDPEGIRQCNALASSAGLFAHLDGLDLAGDSAQREPITRQWGVG